MEASRYGTIGAAPARPASPADGARPPVPESAVSDPPQVDAVLQRAATALLGRLSTLVDRSLARLRAEIVHYSSPLLAPPEVAHSTHVALEVAVGSLAHPERFAESGERAWAVGRKRAAQGIPLLAVTQAYRIGASVIWDGLVEAVMEESPEDAQLLVYAANDFWRWVERDMNLLKEAHRERTVGLTRDDARKLLPALKALLRGHSDPVDLSGAAVILELPLVGRYAVVRLGGAAAERPAEAPVRQEVGGLQLNWCPYADGQVVVALLRDRPVEQLREAVPVGAGVRGGLSPVVDGLAGLRRARELAELALGTCTRDGELAALEDRMSAGFVLSRPDLAGELITRTLGEVMALEATDRRILMETLEVWLDCQGSAGQAGTLLYCHRNTVLNRLRRLERLTGRRLDHPRDLIDLALALDAYRLNGAA
ncbi:helix-turn-helix domain-containing protein [Streptomyces sp. Q6]|uniref:Helix-turn-helix domain-containing protein n=1 Tax=Streptomyces citrinus TaxID=3118173 RepID=A0ACD5A4J2_9ACTN